MVEKVAWVIHPTYTNPNLRTYEVLVIEVLPQIQYFEDIIKA